MGRSRVVAKHECRQSDRTAMGDKEFRKVMDALDKHCANQVKVHAHLADQLTTIELVDCLFPADVVRALITAHGLTSVSATSESYNLYAEAKLWIPRDVFDKRGMLPPNVATVLPYYDGQATLHAAFKVLRKINYEFALLEHIIGWLDANASLSAIRYYWPSIMALSPSCLGSEPAGGRHVTPTGIAPYVPLFRDTATQLASFALMPDPGHVSQLGITVTFPEKTFEVSTANGHLIQFSGRHRTFSL